MDEYLIPNANLLRLLLEKEQYGSLVIAFDFDNTVYDFHHKGTTYYNVIELLRSLKIAGHYLICFTANENTDFIREYLERNDIPFDSINENPPFFRSTTGKIYYNALLDDRAGLIQTYSELKLLLSLKK